MLNSTDFTAIAKLLAKLTLDYVRWTQLIPMIFGWAFVFIMISAIFLVIFQGDIDTLLQRAEPTIERLLGPAPETDSTVQSADEASTINLTGNDIIPWIYRIWGILAFAGWIFSIVRTKIFGPKPPRSLKRKIGTAGIAVLIFTGTLLFAFMIGNFSGNTKAELMIPFILLPILLFIVSTWGLSISHIIDKLHLEIDKLGANKDLEAMSKTTV